MEVHDGKVLDPHVEELDRAITARYDQLVLVDLGPCDIVLRIVGIKPDWGAG
jgi:hypothetical protein